jgi:hypothetical protein
MAEKERILEIERGSTWRRTGFRRGYGPVLRQTTD